MDLIADALTRIRNAALRKKENVFLKQNKLVRSIMEILKREGFIEDVVDQEGGMLVTLLYEDEEPVITHFERVSRGGQRIYVNVADLKPVLSGRGVGLVSTSQGVMTIEEAKSKNTGGEYICNIW